MSDEGNQKPAALLGRMPLFYFFAGRLEIVWPDGRRFGVGPQLNQANVDANQPQKAENEPDAK